MRHRLGNKSLSRPTAHRLLMLRNLVSSLLQHESITTTVAKAKETQKLAEQVIGWGKRGGKSNWDRANSYLLNPTMTLRPLFTTFAERYATRSGGYTRIHRAGNRVGDYAPLAVLELVDSPHDLKYEGTARTVGREMAIRAREGAGPEGWWAFRKRVEGGSEQDVLARLEASNELEAMTKKNIGKALAFRLAAPVKAAVEAVEGVEADDTPVDASLSPSAAFLNRCHHHYLRTLATLQLSTTPTEDPERRVKQLQQRLNPSEYRGAPLPVVTVPYAGRKVKAGERTDGWQLDSLDAIGEGEDRIEGIAGVEVSTPKVGGPISRAKGSKSREGRRQVWTGTKRSAEELAV